MARSTILKTVNEEPIDVPGIKKDIAQKLKRIEDPASLQWLQASVQAIIQIQEYKKETV